MHDAAILMFASPPIADIRQLGCDVRLVPQADVGHPSRTRLEPV